MRLTKLRKLRRIKTKISRKSRKVKMMMQWLIRMSMVVNIFLVVGDL